MNENKNCGKIGMKSETKEERKKNDEGKESAHSMLISVYWIVDFNGLLSIHVSVEWVLFTKIIRHSQ